MPFRTDVGFCAQTDRVKGDGLWAWTNGAYGSARSTKSAHSKWCCRRRQLTDDSAILDFLLAHVGWFDMYVEDDYAAYVRYCFEDPLDAEIFRARFEPKIERFKLAG